MKDSTSNSDAYQDLLHDLSAIIAPLQTLHQQAVAIHAPTVREIICNGSRDKQLIEHTLDQLLDHACIPDGLVLFQTLCRYYWQIDSQATASYVYAYRELWDSDEEVESSKLPDAPAVEVANENNAAKVSRKDAKTQRETGMKKKSRPPKKLSVSASLRESKNEEQQSHAGADAAVSGVSGGGGV